MDLRQLRFFVEIAYSGSFTKAAKRFSIAQPAISVSIRKLEEDLGFVLFNRQKNNVTLTAEGETLLKHAEKILENFATAETEMAEIRGVDKGEVKIGMTPMMMGYLSAETIKLFLETHPKIELAIHSESSVNIHHKISKGEIDVGVLASHSITDQLECRPYLNEEIVACVPKNHSMAKLRTVAVTDFFKEPLISFRSGHYLRKLQDDMAKTTGMKARLVIETNLHSFAQSLIKEHLGVSLLLRKPVSEDKGLAAISFDPPLYIDFVIAWKAGRYMSLANRTFIDFLLVQSENSAAVL